MSVRRVVGASVAAIAIAGTGLLLSVGAGAATPAPTPVSLDLTGLASAACPLPLNGSLAVRPGTTLSLQPDTLLGAASTEKVTIKPAPDSSDKNSSKTIDPIATSGSKVAFAKSGRYTLSYQTVTKSLLGIVQLGASQTGKLVISTKAQKCVVAVNIPTPSVSVTGGSALTSPINGAVSSAVSGANSALSPVNSAVGPILGQVNGAVGGAVSTVTGALPGASKPSTGSAPASSAPGTNYKPSGPTVAQRTVPQGYGSGNGAAGSLVTGGDGNSITAPSIGLTGTDAKSRASKSPSVKSGGSPKTVDLASSSPHSALTGLPALAVALAVIALSTATAFYARTFLLKHPTGSAKA